MSGDGAMKHTIQLEQVRPAEIEARSFEIITEELNLKGIVLPEDTAFITKRCIHTSADFDYAKNLTFSKNAVKEALEAIKQGAMIVTDTNMAKAGINKKIVEQFGGEVCCFMADEDVADKAKNEGTTRATASMQKAAQLAKQRKKPLILAIGNAPTALVTLYEMMQQNLISPKVIIGVPVGFVNVVQAKELIMQSDCEYIVAKGRKGGSNIAACICNALLYHLTR